MVIKKTMLDFKKEIALKKNKELNYNIKLLKTKDYAKKS